VPALVESPESQNAWTPPPAKPLDEAVWQAWLAKGRAEDRRDTAAHIKAVKWVSIAGLLAAAGMWAQLPPYQVALRFLVAAGALAVMLSAFKARRYAFAGIFGALALLYNPAAPIFSFSGTWQYALVLASAVPFAASLTWRNRWKAQA
jgi:hypothetical protein